MSSTYFSPFVINKKEKYHNVRTLVDSKLGVDLFRGSASLELYRGSSLQVAAQRLQKRFIYCLSKEEEYMAIYRASKP